MEKSDKVRIMSYFSPGHETLVILYLVPHFSEEWKCVASVGDPTNQGEHLGYSVVTSNALSLPLVQKKKKNWKRCGLQCY